MSDYEGATAFLGEWGPHQRRVFFLLCVTTVGNGMAVLSIVFVADTPSHQCAVPGRLNLTAAWRNSSIPLEAAAGEEGGAPARSRCARYKVDEVRGYSQRGLVPGVDVDLSQVATEGCLDGWEYDTGMYVATITSEWDLVCDDKWKKPMTSSIFFCGVLTGSCISGQLSDRYGRKIVLFAAMAVESVFRLIQVFSPTWAVFSALHFVVGMGHISNYLVAFVLGTEMFGPRVRTIFSTLGMCLFFSFGYMLIPLCAFFLRDWRRLLFCLNVPTSLCLLLWWLIPESPRWLLSQGRVKEAEAIVRNAAKMNNIQPPPVVFKDLQREPKAEKETAHNIWELLRFPNIRWISLTLWLVWNTLSMAYFVISLNTSNLNGNTYFNCFLSGLVEVPAYVLSWVLFRWCSRRLSVSSTLCLGGACILITPLIPKDLIPLAITLEMTSKFAVSTAFAIVYAYTTELYPTVLRNTALGSCSMASRIGSIIAPYFIYLRNYSTSLPYILMGSLATLTGLLSLLLPESYGMPLPDTIDHMQHFPGGCQKKPYTVAQTEEESNTGERKPEEQH